MPENILNEYNSPDISLCKENRDGIECFGASSPEKSQGLCGGTLA